ncbi:hypothetical protein BGZ65_004355, partial [Modicella reniformis]
MQNPVSIKEVDFMPTQARYNRSDEVDIRVSGLTHHADAFTLQQELATVFQPLGDIRNVRHEL